jgi:outer membrane protein assembly factor BamB
VLTVTGANTTLALLYFWLRKYLPDAAWAGPTVLFGLLVVVTFGGLVWATRRADRLPSPPAGERKWLIAAAVGLGLFVAGIGWWAGWGELVRLPWAAFTAAAVGAGLTVFWRSEPVALFGTGVPLVGCGLVTQVNPPAPVDHPHEPPVRVLFETPDYDAVLSGLTVNDRRVYFGVSKQTGFRTAGAVLSVDLGTGRERWRFDADGTLRPVFATPTLGSSGLLVGEGLHADSDCRVFALSTDTGRPKWDKPFQTAGHVEGSPGIIRIESYNQDVCVPAGADGLYRLNARTGLKKWHRTEPGLHVDTAPLADDRFNMRANLHSLAVYVGSGYGWKGVLKVDADTGQVIWRTPTDLRVFGQGFGTPSRVYFGLGSGTLTDDLVAEPDEPPAPAGAVVCLDNNTGAVVWQTGLPRSAHTGLASDGSRVFAACRDGSVYALDHRTGAVVWSRAVGGPFLAAPVVHSHGRLSVVTGDGRYAALNGDTGELHWTCDLSAPLGREVRAGSLVIGPGGERVLVGVGLTNRFNGATAAAIVEISP